VASIVTLLTLNTNKRADLGGLASIIKETKPHVVFIQEALSYNLVSSLASASGYRCWASTLPGVRRDRTLAVLSRLPHTAVQEVVPGQAQLVTVGGLSFINIHAPSIKTESNAFFTSLRPHLSSPIAPVLIGDFNCCLFPIDYGLPILPAITAQPAFFPSSKTSSTLIPSAHFILPPFPFPSIAGETNPHALTEPTFLHS